MKKSSKILILQMQTITKQWICKTVEMKLLFLEQFAIKWASSACIAVQNFAF